MCACVCVCVCVCAEVTEVLRNDVMFTYCEGQSCDRREQVVRVGAAAPRVFNSKYLFILHGSV